jgi:hypothetical protein
MTHLSPRNRVAFGLISLAFTVAACGGSVKALSTDGSANGRGGTVGGGGSAGNANGGNGGYDGPTLGVEGGGKIPIGTTQCSDGKDNDGDGLVDYLDPECIGPLDNDEGSFATGIPGDNVDSCKQDCFFDGNSGMGDDGCEWQLKCDMANPGKGVGCPYDPNFKNCPTMQSDKCINNCRKLVPNGCDCFGCCEIPGVGGLLLLPTCTAAKFSDPVACPRCTQRTDCANPCERCEICVGKPTIPADCGGTGGAAGSGGAGGAAGSGGAAGAGGAGGYTPPPRCDNGAMPCGPGGIDPVSCPQGTGCITGCCLPVVQ